MTTRLAVLVPTAVLGLLLAFQRPAGADDAVRLSADLDRTPASQGTEVHPVALDPDEPLRLRVSFDNQSPDDITIRAIRLEGQVMGLTFFSYDARVDTVIEARHQRTLRFDLDLVGLRGQATGLIPARVVAVDGDQRVIASQSTVVDVRGSVRSVYGGFGLAVAVFTGLSAAGAMLGLARHQLSPNRWRRAVRFLWPGIGVGLLLVFSLSAFRVYVPEPSRWLPLVLISAAVLFVIGYLTPTPDELEPAGSETGEGVASDDGAEPIVTLVPDITERADA